MTTLTNVPAFPQQQRSLIATASIANTIYAGNPLSIQALSFNGTTAIATTEYAHGLTTGQILTISGSPIAAYNAVSVSITVISTTQFTYTMASTPASAVYPTNGLFNGNVATYTITMPAITAISFSSTTATATTATAHGLAIGDIVGISGASQNPYNGIFAVATVPSATTFTYTMTVTPTVAATTATLALCNDVVNWPGLITLGSAGVNGSILTGLWVSGATTVAATDAMLYLQKGGIGPIVPIDSVTLTANTISTSAQNVKTVFQYSDAAPLRLGISDVLYVAIGVANASGITDRKSVV